MLLTGKRDRYADALAAHLALRLRERLHVPLALRVRLRVRDRLEVPLRERDPLALRLPDADNAGALYAHVNPVVTSRPPAPPT